MKKALVSSICACMIMNVNAETESMAQIKALSTNNAPKAIGPFSQAISVKNPQEIVYISGQLPLVPETGELVSDPTQATNQCMKNIAAILSTANMSFDNVVETMILLKDIKDFKQVNEAYASFLKEPYPARATFQAGALPLGAVIEIKMTAVR